jgi:hypothetical protein
VGGVLVMLGASLPWLTLYAGLQQYSGLVGAHGQVLFAGGMLAIVASLGIQRTNKRWVRWTTVILGLTLLVLNAWLVGLVGTLSSGAAAVLVPHPGPGLIVSSLGIVLLILGPGLGLVRRGDR